MREAWACLIQEQQDLAQAELVRRHQELANTNASKVEAEKLVAYVDGVKEMPDLLEKERARYYSNSHNEPGSFEKYWASKVNAAEEARNTIYLTPSYRNCNCIDLMSDPEYTARFDHIITDIPYGIDMDNLMLSNINNVRNEHDVDDNKRLMEKFFPAAYSCLKDSGFCITWCDQMLWQYMYDLACAAGFRVQRWPITWVKTHVCANQCAQYNFTKTTEIAIVCRKENAVLVKPQTTCHIIASNESTSTKTHPFMKPFDAWQFLINAVSIEGQLILEPFAGHGSCVTTALQLRRRVMACELNTNHYNYLLENVKKFYLTLNPRSKFL